LSNYKLNVAPRFYQFQDNAIPNGLTLAQGTRYLQGCGASTAQASSLSLHDRACGLAARLATLVGQSGDPELIRKAEHEIQKWNDECAELFSPR
jgi:hypothetical protein